MPEYLRVFANMAGGRRYFFADPSRMEAQTFILEARLWMNVRQTATSLTLLCHRNSRKILVIFDSGGGCPCSGAGGSSHGHADDVQLAPAVCSKDRKV